MDKIEVESLLKSAVALDEVYVSTEDGNHFQVIAVGEIFAKMTRVQKQQAIYSPLSECIATNKIHALTIKTYTPEEWKLARKLALF